MRFTKAAHGGFTVLCLSLSGLAVARLCGLLRLPGEAAWPDVALLLAAAMSTLLALARELPAQNVLGAAVIIGALGSLAQATVGRVVSALVPVHGGRLPPAMPDALAWFTPFVWMVAVLNSRGVARLILRPWREARDYGWRVLGLTTALCGVFDLGFEPFAAGAVGGWHLQPADLTNAWHRTQAALLVGWELTTLLVLAAATPFLIKKKPAERPPDYHALLLWTLAIMLFATGAFVTQSWRAGTVDLIFGLVAIVLACRGARR